jgi:osmoprotectant transport system permease protein
MSMADPLSTAALPRWRPVQALLSLTAIGGLLGLPLLRVAPNRLVSGEPTSFASLLHGPVWGLATLLVGLLLLSLLPPRRVTLWLAVAAATALTVGLGALAASHAAQVVQADTPFARTSLGSGLWWTWLMMGLVLADALQALRAGALTRLGVATAVLLPMAWLLASGAADELSIMKEYVNRSDEFWLAIVRHGQIVALALAFTLAIGLPLGWAAHRYARARRAALPVLN